MLAFSILVLSLNSAIIPVESKLSQEPRQRRSNKNNSTPHPHQQIWVYFCTWYKHRRGAIHFNFLPLWWDHTFPWNIPSQTEQGQQICLHHPIQEPQLQIPSFYKMFCGVSPKGQQSAFNNWWTKIVHGFPRSKMEKKREICWAMPLHEKFVLQWVRTRRGGGIHKHD